MPDAKTVFEAFAELLPADQRQSFVDRLLRDARASERVEQLHRQRVGPALAHCTEAFERRFGPVPRELSEQLSVMEPAMLRATQDVIERSNDRAAFWPAYDRLRDALGDAKVLGARHLLLRLLLRKFGSDVHQYDNVIARCDIRTLNQCFERLMTATSLEDVLGPSLDQLAGA